MKLSFSTVNESPVSVDSDALVVFVGKNKALSNDAKTIEEISPGLILNRIEAGDLPEKNGSSFVLFEPKGLRTQRLTVIYTEQLALDAEAVVEFCNAVFKVVTGLNQKNVSICLSGVSVNDQDSGFLPQQLTDVFVQNCYEFKGFKSDDDVEKAGASLSGITYVTNEADAITGAVSVGKGVGNGKNFARHLGNLPPNVCHPTYLAETALTLAEENEKLTVRILDEAEMKALGMDSLLSVGHGSAQDSKLIVMEYNGAAKDEKPYALVGKGVTFDSGGISIKPGAAMDEMKFDMCGAASVFGAVVSVLELNLPINLVAVVGAVENMPSDCATRPGDVVKSMSGKTIEILNTDAEGRLVLCDALTYVQRYEPKTIIDIATLTGAIIMALGDQAAGLFTNDEAFAKQLIKSGTQSGDKVWQFPIWSGYSKKLASNFADLANIGTPGAGSITAACFLSEFVKDQTWAHIDIAGVAWQKGSSKGATGKPVGLLVDYLMNAE